MNRLGSFFQLNLVVYIRLRTPPSPPVLLETIQRAREHALGVRGSPLAALSPLEAKDNNGEDDDDDDKITRMTMMTNS